MKKNSNILRKTSRKELIEMLLLQNKKIEELTYELENLKNTSNEENLKILSSGTLAEAALKLNKIFEDADAAAKLYLDNIKELEIQYKNKICELNNEIVNGVKNEEHNKRKENKNNKKRKQAPKRKNN